MRIPIYQVDAFASRPFAGNPAAVCPLDTFPDAALMQAIAAENNLSETAFVGPADSGADYAIRWFTPAVEVNLCGHATLAAAHVIFNHLEPARARVVFASRSGPLTVTREGGLLAMSLPADPPSPMDGADKTATALAHALGDAPVDVLRCREDVLAVFATARAVVGLAPRFAEIAALDARGVIVSAPGDGACDFVSRFFAPAAGIDEDPVTGSAHCALAPYWAGRLGRSALTARQVSARGGEVICRIEGARVVVAGAVTDYLSGEIVVPG